MWPESGGMTSDPEFLLFITLLSQQMVSTTGAQGQRLVKGGRWA